MKEYYDRRAPEYDATAWEHPERTDEEHQEQQQLVEALASLPPALTLDVACGTGYLSRHLPGHVVGTDYSEAMLQIARRRGISVVRADGLRLPFRDRSFERVVAAHFYGHLQPDEATLFLSEARRVAPHLVLVDSAPGLRMSDADWEERVLDDGSRHRIYKRFFHPDDLRAQLGGGEVLFSGRLFVAIAA